MPGSIVCAECPCGFHGGLGLMVGVTGPEFGYQDSKYYILAYDTENQTLISIDSREAEQRGLRTIQDPKLKGTHVFDDSKGRFVEVLDIELYECPRCRQNTMSLSACGHWD